MSTPRLISLDVFRGLTVIFMIFVNNGAGSQIFPALQHSKWNGLTPCDLVFPFFLFIMGISTYLSLKKTHFKQSRNTTLKIVRRTATLILIGLFINWFDMACSGRALDFSHLRIMGVMQRIALCYGATALIAIETHVLFKNFKPIPLLAIILLTVYSAIILMGGGYNYDASTNLAALFDIRLLGYDHLYHKSPVDPEGLLSTISAIAHTLIGFGIASWTLNGKDTKTPSAALKRYVAAGLLLVSAGFLLTYIMPLNKRIWSPSYVLATCGLASLIQGLLIYFIDILPHSRTLSAPSSADKRAEVSSAAWSWVLVFGTNPLFLYVASEVISIMFGASGIKDTAYNALHSLIAHTSWAGAAYAALFVLLHALIGYPLWKRKIYIKI